MTAITPINCQVGIRTLQLSMDGTLLLTAHTDNTLCIWDTRKFTLIQTIHLDESIRDFALSPDNKTLAILTAPDVKGKPMAIAGAIHCYDLVANQFLYAKKVGDCRCVAYIENQIIVIGCLDRGGDREVNSLRFYTLNDCQQMSVLPLPQPDMPFSLIAIPQRHTLLSLGIGLTIVDSTKKNIVHEIHCDNLDVDWDIWETTCFTVNQLASIVAVGFDTYGTKYGKRVCLFDLETWASKGWFVTDKRHPTHVAISDDGRYLAAVLYGSDTVSITDIQSGEFVTSINIDAISAMTFLPHSNNLIIGTQSDHPLAILEWHGKVA